MAGKPWTRADHATLIDCANQGLSAAEISRRIGRTVASIHRVAFRKRIQIRRTKYTPWTFDELVKLSEWWGVKTTAEIASELSRSPNDVWKKARKAGVVGWTPKEVALLRAGYGSLTMKTLVKSLLRPANHIDMKAKLMGLGNKFQTPVASFFDSRIPNGGCEPLDFTGSDH